MNGHIFAEFPLGARSSIFDSMHNAWDSHNFRIRVIEDSAPPSAVCVVPKPLIAREETIGVYDFMSNILVMNVSLRETRVAVLENGVISGFHNERHASRGVVGNIYHGRVVRVLPGMEAAFVDIGLEKAAFLHASDIFQDHSAAELPDDDSDDDDLDGDGDGEGGKGRQGSSGRRKRRREYPPIEEQLREGQDLLVQVVKDPIGTKGARLTCYISLPGRHLVFMPTVGHVGISRQIRSDTERKRLRKLCDEMRPQGAGFIVRTAAEGVRSEALRQDMEVLINLWNDIYKRSQKGRPPRLLHTDLDLSLRAARDLAASELDRLIVDDREHYERIMDFVERVMPRFSRSIELYVGTDPIFDAFGIEDELRRALEKRVDLPSGGYLIIEQTEALTSIDINTGKFVGEKTLEDTITLTNMEAAKEIAYQLKLRNIGGLIIIDFIDMQDSSDRKKVTEALHAAFADDKGRVKFTEISEFGLVEMTRKRTSESLTQLLCETCTHCQGRGIVRSTETTAYEILRELKRQLEIIEGVDVTLRANPKVAKHLKELEADSLRLLESSAAKRLHVRAELHLHPEDWMIQAGKP